MISPLAHPMGTLTVTDADGKPLAVDLNVRTSSSRRPTVKVQFAATLPDGTRAGLGPEMTLSSS